MKRLAVLLISLVILSPSLAMGEAGVIIPSNIKDRPDPSIVSLAHMHVRVNIVDQYATVRVIQIFENKIDRDIEGKYIFSLPDQAQVSAFAIWEDGVRIPAVIVERQKASELYEELTSMKIDPGLAETGDIDEQNLFTVMVYPIPAHGTKRIELTYTAELPVQSLRSQFTLPLKPSLYSEQTAGRFQLDFDFRSSQPITGFQQRGSSLQMDFREKGANAVKGSFSGQQVPFIEDFAVEYQLDSQESSLAVTTHRDKRQWQDIGPLSGGARFSDSSGYFAAHAVFNESGGAGEAEPLKLVLAVDTSISMQWTKLTACFKAVEYFLRGLTADDQFTLLCFNDGVEEFSQQLQPATAESVGGALEFFKRRYLRGGTDLAAAIERAKLLAEESGATVVLITDGAPTAGEVDNNAISATAASAGDAKLMIFGIGNDARADLLRRLASENGGHFAWVSESEDIDFKLARFLEALSEPVISRLALNVEQDANLDSVYLNKKTSVFDRSDVTWLGRYLTPATATMQVSGYLEGSRISLESEVDLPEEDLSNPQLPRRWAQLRVNHLLRQIDLSEDPAEVAEMEKEIVFLSRKYMFVTPYTSFLAAPRSLLRPRAMKAGDPVLRVKTVQGITAVVARFPFGLTKPLHYSEDDDSWETRFLAPASMRDGRYHVDLYLTDQEGTVYHELKQFTVDSKPPTLRLETEAEAMQPGRTVTFKIYADSDTREIIVRIDGLMPVEARWDPEEKANVARITLPADMRPGTYSLKISAVDFARNTAVLSDSITVEESK